MKFDARLGYTYRGYIIKKGEYGWFGEPTDERPSGPHLERWGCTRNMRTALEAEIEVDNLIDR